MDHDRTVDRACRADGVTELLDVASLDHIGAESLGVKGKVDRQGFALVIPGVVAQRTVGSIEVARTEPDAALAAEQGADGGEALVVARRRLPSPANASQGRRELGFRRAVSSGHAT
jgi:hypothetical protein